MRINKFVALATGISRRTADELIQSGAITVNGLPVAAGYVVKEKDAVASRGKILTRPSRLTTIMLHKPIGYVCSREGQGSKTVYDLVPHEYHSLKPVGRLDKDSSGLLLLTNDGQLAQELTHPSRGKSKVYDVTLNKPLAPADAARIISGIKLSDGISKLRLKGTETKWTVTMSEGRNRQIRRTFAKAGYNVVRLHRTSFGVYQLNQLEPGKYKDIMV